ncbi:MAG: alpha-hydroxy-acid oxidizing protein [Lactobacillaceae bacterium]|nr:alpha-hydroxy-acid oxidizing protein [Lactobacillaceae bacterium]
MEYTASTAEQHIDILNLESLRDRVKENTEPGAFGYVAGAASDEQVLDENRKAFNHFQLVPRVLQNIEKPDMTTELLGIPLSMPIIGAPIAAHGLMHEGGEKVSAKGVGMAGTIMSVSTYGNARIDEVENENPGTPKFFQLYMSDDDNFNQYLLNMAYENNYKAIILTADATLGGYREDDIKTGFTFPIPMENLASFSNAAGSGQGMNIADIYAKARQSLNLADIKKVKSMAHGLPVFVKGIQDPEDAVAAIDFGADGIWVSNHGGRELNGAPGSIDVLPSIAQAVGKRVPIVFDSGIRRGEDVGKALALGADVVALGRPMLWALNLGGAQGVSDAFNHLAMEFNIVMQLTGSHNIEEMKKAHILTK